MKKIKHIFGKSAILVALVVLAVACSQNKPDKPVEQDDTQKTTETTTPKLPTPVFNGDSAYAFVKKQVDFGPRVPGSKAHAACAAYLAATLKNYGAEVQVQTAKTTTYDKKTHDLKNIIASFNPKNNSRILLCAHWDTRHVADRDFSKQTQPIDGANDGGSGVAVLLEIARQLKVSNSPLGIDIVLFDLEDYGEPRGAETGMEDSWCLGAQYWAKNPHKPGYFASYGILLDMVGAKDATFLVEATGDYFASWVNKKIWDNAVKLGYSNYFIYDKFGPITDDHVYINQLIHIPTVDVIHWDKARNDFWKFHHTHGDNLDAIDKNTLKAVGQTVLETVYTP